MNSKYGPYEATLGFETRLPDETDLHIQESQCGQQLCVLRGKPTTHIHKKKNNYNYYRNLVNAT